MATDSNDYRRAFIEPAAPVPRPPQGSKKNEKPAPQDDNQEYPSGKAFASIMFALLLPVFLVTIDRTIISTAIPAITDEFNSLGDIGWYGSAYLITGCGFMPLSGKIYTFYPAKWVFLVQMVIFEIGSVLCGWAPTSTAFIVGRAIAGGGSSGLITGAIVLLTDAVPLHKRSSMMGAFAGIFGVSGVVAPLMGGAFAQHATWRWSFWINIPIGVVTIATLSCTIKAQPPRKKLTVAQKIRHLDPIGTALFLPSMVCLLLALQWGGIEYPWSSGRVIALFVVFGMTIVPFIAIQIYKQEEATIPPRIISQRSVACGLWFQLCLGGVVMLIIYYLPIWFQAIQGVDATNSGVHLIPTILSFALSSIGAGIAVRFLGYYTPFMIASSVIASIGSGMLSTLTPFASASKWIGFQIICGFGLGLGMQQPSVAVQAVLDPVDIPIGSALVIFYQTLGGALFIAVGQNELASKLLQGLSEISGKGFDAGEVIHIGATEVNQLVSPEFLPQVHSVYNHAITHVLYVGVGLACASILGAFGMEWVSTRKGLGKELETPEEAKA